MSEPALRRFETWDGLVQAAAEALGGALEHALRERGSASLALAGGGTPADIYRRLSHRELDWPRVSVTPTDERWVEADSPESNARLVRETLLQGRAASARLLPLKEEGRPTPEAAAQGAEAALAAVWPLDAVLLGMGGDGHFASLFPGSASLPAGLDPCGDRRVISVPAGTPAPTQPRLSLTLAALGEARLLVLAIRGAEKMAALERARDAALPIAALLQLMRRPPLILSSPGRGGSAIRPMPSTRHARAWPRRA
ncbi:MAG: 6-phosphogluconolactonase, partial [Proteobacteria bacterium]|nr:6-phosphogluconolactonase [Pseudomonadota bacterium]